MDLWRTYGKTTGREVSFKLVDWQEGLDLVMEGKADYPVGMYYLSQFHVSEQFRVELNASM